MGKAGRERLATTVLPACHLGDEAGGKVAKKKPDLLLQPRSLHPPRKGGCARVSVQVGPPQIMKVQALYQRGYPLSITSAFSTGSDVSAALVVVVASPYSDFNPPVLGAAGRGPVSGHWVEFAVCGYFQG